MEYFIHNVLWLRRHYGLSKKKMAEILGISLFMINKIENGQLPPTLEIDVLFRIHKAFGITMADILSIRLGSDECADLFPDVRESKPHP